MKNTDARSQGKRQGMNWIRKDKRLALGLRDGMACAYCGEGVEDGATLTLDHILCHSQGGSNHESNLITACRRCNSRRSDRDLGEWCEIVAAYNDHGVTALDILNYIADRTAQPLAPYRAEARQILSRRPSWQAALEAASK